MTTGRPDPREAVLALSRRHAPPRTDLRQANIADDYGDESGSLHPIDHDAPEDVTRQDLDAYPHVWPFMSLTDQLFYLHAVATIFVDDPSLDCIDSYLYSLDWRASEGHLSRLGDDDRSTLIGALTWIWEMQGCQADWEGCPHLQVEIGLLADDLA